MKLDHLPDHGAIERYDYPDRIEFVADFGPAADPAIDIVGDTVIVVTSDGTQRDIKVPDDDVRAFNRNGIVTIEVSQ